MTRDKIEREAGKVTWQVINEKREFIESVMKKPSLLFLLAEWFTEAITDFAISIAEKQREMDAKIAERFIQNQGNVSPVRATAEMIAQAIRGQKEGENETSFNTTPASNFPLRRKP
jgi:hypothetical protein